MEPGGSLPHSQRPSNNRSRFNPFPRIDTYLFKILILSSHLRLGHSKSIFPVGVPLKMLKAVPPSSILATWSAHLNLLDLITLPILGERYKLWNSPLGSLLHSPFSSLLGPNICIRILFSNTLSLHSSLNVRDHVSQPYSTTGNIIVLYILIFNFLERSAEDYYSPFYRLSYELHKLIKI